MTTKQQILARQAVEMLELAPRDALMAAIVAGALLKAGPGTDVDLGAAIISLFVMSRDPAVRACFADLYEIAAGAAIMGSAGIDALAAATIERAKQPRS